MHKGPNTHKRGFVIAFAIGIALMLQHPEANSGRKPVVIKTSPLLEPSPGTLTLANVVNHYGASLKATDTMCWFIERAPKTRNLLDKNEDCRHWDVENTVGFSGKVIFSRTSYHVNNDGFVIKISHYLDGDCESVIRSFFGLKGLLTNPYEVTTSKLLGTFLNVEGNYSFGSVSFDVTEGPYKNYSLSFKYRPPVGCHLTLGVKLTP